MNRFIVILTIYCCVLTSLISLCEFNLLPSINNYLAAGYHIEQVPFKRETERIYKHGPLPLVNTKCIAHRGQNDIYPENTLRALREALLNHADGLELDIRLTKDNYVIVHHDLTLERCTNGVGTIRDVNFVGYIDGLKSSYHSRYPTEPVSLLEDVLVMFEEVARANQTMLIDIKDNNDILILDHLRPVLLTPQRIASGLLKHITLGIWDQRFHARASSLFGSEGVKLSLITRSIKLASASPFSGGGVQNFNLGFPNLYFDLTGFYNRIREENRNQLGRGLTNLTTVYVWTVNSVSGMRAALQMGVDAILSDHLHICQLVVYLEGTFYEQQELVDRLKVYEKETPPSPDEYFSPEDLEATEGT